MAQCTVRHPKTVTSSLSLLNEEPKTAGVVPRFVVVMVVVRPVLGRFAGARDGSDDRGGADGRGGSDDRATVFGGGTGEAGGSSSDISTVSVDNKKDKERGDKETAVREHVFGWTSFHPSLFSLSLYLIQWLCGSLSQRHWCVLLLVGRTHRQHGGGRFHGRQLFLDASDGAVASIQCRCSGDCRSRAGHVHQRQRAASSDSR